MAIRSFSVGPAKGLVHAAWDGLPNLVVISGPNGSGKSTLLSLLWKEGGNRAEPGTEIIYVGPNRPWRKSTLNGAAPYSLSSSYREMLGMQHLPGWRFYAPQGLESIGNQPRDPDSFDEVASLAKISLMKLGQRRLELLGTVYDRNSGAIPLGEFPDVFMPLRTMVSYLLPHLEFDTIDTSDPQNIRCLFRRVDGGDQAKIDIDDLSSGEKAIITLFLPFLDSQISKILDSSFGGGVGPRPTGNDVLPTALIDEPEIHLHPILQVSLLEYLRELTRLGEAQFILTTHSPTILDAAMDNELFMLAPVSSVGDGNQFIRIASSEERLETIRSITGSTHLLTRCRPIVFVEGETAQNTRVATDERLIELIIPESSSWVVVPVKGRVEAIRAAEQLRDAASEGLPGVSVFALVDSDRGIDGNPDYVIPWPVAMIENLLLDAQVIHDYLYPFRNETGFRIREDVSEALRKVAYVLVDDEVRLRTPGVKRGIRIEMDLSSGEWQDARDRATDQLERQLGSIEHDFADMQSRKVSAEQEVQAILENHLELEKFRGKEILKRFHDLHVKKVIPGYKAFVYGLGQQTRGTGRLINLTSLSFQQIQYFVPASLEESLERLVVAIEDDHVKVNAEKAAEHAKQCREWWLSLRSGDLPESVNSAEIVDLDKLRRDAVEMARASRNAHLFELERELLRALAQIGPGRD